MEKINLETSNDAVAHEELAPKSKPSTSSRLPLLPILITVAVIIGATSGVILAQSQLKSGKTIAQETSSIPGDQNSIKVGTSYGSKDENIFPDKAEGIVVEGGVGGEGSHHLVRTGGVSQNVYMSSSVVDLDLVAGARVQVWGQTMNAKKAGWLMDVGRLKVLELNAPMPE